MGETLITELLRYCKTTYGIDLSRLSSTRESALCEDLYAEVPGGPGARRAATVVRSNPTHAAAGLLSAR